jgi:uncharacterized protein YyaL (SSP411 family)
MINTDKTPNRLIHEKSPYLLHHAYNPVDWHPWSPEAFEKAKREDKPIFLSIGYHACHWCHVMEQESFEDEEVAGILNSHYIAIKVDREERPDIDHMYMTYCQALTGGGGWPLTVIMTPAKQPFFAGTYFPKHSFYGRPGLTDILQQISELWQADKPKVLETAAELYKAVSDRYHEKKRPQDEGGGGSKKRTGISLRTSTKTDNVFDWGKDAVRQAYGMLQKSFDPKFGGFGNAPKFPSPHNLGFLLRFSLAEPASGALAIVEKTLESMADGGIYDHVGFGFARYSTDRYWLVPHFEKMLYDNAGLALVYLEAYQLTKNERFIRIAREIFEYVLRDMTSPEGGFYSAEDADSEGQEGKYYVWDESEIKRTLIERIAAPGAGMDGDKEATANYKIIREYCQKKEKLAEIYCQAYGIQAEGNYEGKNIPSRIFSIWEVIAEQNELSLEDLEKMLAFCNEVLFAAREKRIRPAKDDKILVAWNGLMIAALAKGAQVFTGKPELKAEREAFILAAEKAAGFILAKMFNPQGRLLARYREGEAGYFGYLDDYAFLIYGLLEVYTVTGKPEYLEQALKLQAEQERLFRDAESGGYYFTGNDAEELLLRPKETYDGAMPSGNSLSAFNLVRLWKLTGQQKWQELAEQQFNFFRAGLEDYPPGHTALLQALQFYLNEGEELVLSGPLDSEMLENFQKTIFADFRPYAVLAYNEGTLARFIPKMKDYPLSPKLSVYLCRNFSCREPVDQPEELEKLLKA